MSSTIARSSEAKFLHPLMRDRAQKVVSACEKAGLPFKLFEAWRSPERQAQLYGQGRTSEGRIVSFANAWQSYHQYGLACDFVGFIDGRWTWDLPKAAWTQLHQIGASLGLEKLGFEEPHLQIAGLSIGELMDGHYPDAGDGAWADNLAAAVWRWTGKPKAPPAPSLTAAGSVDRPSLVTATLDWSTAPEPNVGDWRSKFGGVEWRYDARGVYLRDSPSTPRRSKGSPITCAAIVDLFGPIILETSLDTGIAPELIVMTIATETAFARAQNFTGPKTFRWEPGIVVKDQGPPDTGDYSAGPMQMLASTARWVIRAQALPLDPNVVAPHFTAEPESPPSKHPLYDAKTNLLIGTAEIRQRLSTTGDDPILIAAAYNAGGLYESDGNPWRMRSTKAHLDRASEWYGDACFVLSSLRG